MDAVDKEAGDNGGNREEKKKLDPTRPNCFGVN